MAALPESHARLEPMAYGHSRRDEEVLSETTLRDLSVTFRSRLPGPHAKLNSDEAEYSRGSFQSYSLTSVRSLRVLLGKLFESANQVNLSKSHRTAAFNCLCGFIDQVSSSLVAEVQEVSLNSNVFLRLFSLYLARSSDASTKAARQLLATLMKLLSNLSSRAIEVEHLTPEHSLLAKCMIIVHNGRSTSSVKPALHILQLLFSKGTIDLSCFTLVSQSLRSYANLEMSCQIAAEDFMDRLFCWTRHLDVAPIVGRLLPTFVCFLHDSFDKSLVHSPTTDGSPLWSTSLKKAISRDPEQIGNFELYILPDLLATNKKETLAFVQKLPLESLKLGRCSGIAETDIRTTLVVLKSLQRLGLTAEAGILKPRWTQTRGVND